MNSSDDMNLEQPRSELHEVGRIIRFIDLCIFKGMASHSCFAPDRIPLAM